MNKFVKIARSCKNASLHSLKEQASTIANKLTKFSKEEKKTSKYKEYLFAWRLIRNEMSRRV